MADTRRVELHGTCSCVGGLSCKRDRAQPSSTGGRRRKSTKKKQDTRIARHRDERTAAQDYSWEEHHGDGSAY